MFIPFTIRTVTIPSSVHIQRECVCCNESRKSKILYHYMSFRPFWLFGVITRRWYIAACAECGTREYIKKRELGGQPLNIHVPYLDKWGLLTIVSSFVIFGICMHYLR